MQSLATIEADEEMSDHLQAVHDALDHLVSVLLQATSSPDTDLHTAQLFGIRLFNVGAASVKVGLCGYYQQAWHLLRDSLEVVDLIDLFRADRTLIAVWRTADDRTLYKRFRPAEVRKALDGFPEYAGQKQGRERIYSLLSKQAVHATYAGFRLVELQGGFRPGPAFDAQRLRALLQDLGRYLAHAALALSDLMGAEGLSTELLRAKMGYLGVLRAYSDKYIKR